MWRCGSLNLHNCMMTFIHLVRLAGRFLKLVVLVMISWVQQRCCILEMCKCCIIKTRTNRVHTENRQFARWLVHTMASLLVFTLAVWKHYCQQKGCHKMSVISVCPPIGDLEGVTTRRVWRSHWISYSYGCKIGIFQCSDQHLFKTSNYHWL